MSKKMFILLTSFSLILGFMACGGSGSKDKKTVITPHPADPIPMPDIYEDGSGDNSFSTATDVSIDSAPQEHSIFPIADLDFYRVYLEASVDYEFAAYKLFPFHDTEMYLYLEPTNDIEHGHIKMENDDFKDYWNKFAISSRINYTPTVSGDYYLMVRSTQFPFGIVLSYTFSAHTFVDNDKDGYSTFIDCDDSDITINVGATEIPGDGIDQNCNGVDEPSSDVPDKLEPANNTKNGAELLTYRITTDRYAIQYQYELYKNWGRTLDTTLDVDWYHLVLPAYHKLLVGSQNYSNVAYMDIYDSDDVTVDCINHDNCYVTNTNNSDADYYVRVTFRDNSVAVPPRPPFPADSYYYVPYVVDVGVDLDGDGYYTLDWSDRTLKYDSYDCNDNDPDINREATGDAEKPNDGVDSDCNGEDNTWGGYDANGVYVEIQ